MIRTATGWTFQLVRLLSRESPKLRESNAGARPESLDRCMKRYEEEIAQLRLENEYLRTSATMFGELAERLSDALRKAGSRGQTPERQMRGPSH